MNTKPVIIAIAKQEKNYIEEWVRWHIALGFDHIYLYDNEDIPTYQVQLEKYKEYVTVIHMPGNRGGRGVQYLALHHFKNNFMLTNSNTHVAHIDIDEFIVLRESFNITKFIDHFFIDDCGAIGINWRLFGDSGQETEEINQPVIKRFTYRQKNGDKLFKSLWKISAFHEINNVHCFKLKEPYKTKNTNKDIIYGTYNRKPHFNFIQINHYRCKTFSEFSRRLSILRADSPVQKQSLKEVQDADYISSRFNRFNTNDEQDLIAYNAMPFVDIFWKNYFS